MTATTVKQLKPGEFFTLRPVEEPTYKQVYIRGEYDRSEKKYSCGRYDDISYSRGFDGKKVVYVGFTF